jgi:tRNA uridine 5-carboxymethylaminomethyl modification enzyme
MLSINLDTIGQMSCNPAIGGLAKGQLVREIDAIGGEMARATDMTGLQFRMLNKKKGPSVWAPRAQCDKKAYQFRLKWLCEKTENLDVRQGQVTQLLHKDNQVFGVETNLGVQYLAKVVIVTTGTFLRGLMHVGSAKQPGGRSGESASINLSDSLRDIGLELGRLKTGTPPRILKRSIDFSKTEAQIGDNPVPYFSFWKRDLFHVEHLPLTQKDPSDCTGKYAPGSILDRINGQLPCHVTFTTRRTADLVRANLHKSPMYSGEIEGVGPRYCPSIEDKIVKFPEKERHQIFLEPEGISTDEIYVNGFSTCLPFDVQFELVRTIIGCEHAEIMRSAYAVEYDFVFPTQLHLSLETKVCRNLFMAGQINGTSGYEEAGAQGLMAGINAARRVQNLDPVVLRRDEAYIGVLIDDLITKGTTEPYRMFTSRAEHRLLLRQDNADLRLSEIGYQIGLLPRRNYEQVIAKKKAIACEIDRLENTRQGTSTLAQFLRRPEVRYSDLPNRNDDLDSDVIVQVEITLKYSGYIERQEREIEKFRSLERKRIPDWIDYNSILGLRTEARQKLAVIRPTTVGQALRISGVSPADVSLIMVWMKRASGDCEIDSRCEATEDPLENNFSD